MVVWMSTKFPVEIPAVFGAEIICPESFAAAAAGKGMAGQYLAIAGELGYSEDLCSYMRIGLALAETLAERKQEGFAGPGAAGLPPYPDALLCCTNICCSMMNWYRNMAEILDVPMMLLDIPFRGEIHSVGNVPEAWISYLRGQAEEIIAGLSALSGKPWSGSRFREIAAAVRESTDAWEELLTLSAEEPGLFENFELFDDMPGMVADRWKTETAEYLRGRIEEIRRRKELLCDSGKETKPEYRVYFEGTPCWARLSLLKNALNRAGMKISADTITPSLSFRYQDFDGMLAAYCRTINGSPFEEGSAQRQMLIKKNRAEAALFHYNRSCRPWCGTLPATERMLKASCGLPGCSFQGDQADENVLSPALLESSLEGLREVLEGRKS